MDRENRVLWSVRPMEERDQEAWLSLDEHLDPEAFQRKVRDGMGLVVEIDGEVAAILRYFLFWDNIPFCSLLFVRGDLRKQGYGTLLMRAWEEEMLREGHDLVMTSTQADEGAQHFYRKLGYADCGGFILPFSGYEQPLELIMAKSLEP